MAALINEGKEIGGKSAKIASEIETERKNGKEVSREKVKQLIESNEIYIKAEEQVAAKTAPEPDTLEQAAREVVARKNKTDAANLLEARRRGEVNGEVLDRLTENGVEITADEVRKVTGFGEEGAKLVTKLANQEGKTFTQAVKAVKSAYDAGFTDLKASKVSFVNAVQKAAFDAGKIDRGVQDREAVARSLHATARQGVFTENEYTKDFTEPERKMISTFAKSLKMDASVVDKVIANVVNGNPVEANARHQDGEMAISSTAQKVLFELVMHEGGHRMKQLAPMEFGELANALYARAARRSAKLGVPHSTSLDSIKAEHDNAGIIMDTSGYLEEFAVRELETIFSSAEEFNNWYAEISGNQKARTGFEKFMDWVHKVIEDIKRTLDYTKMSKAERAEAKRAVAELERIKELYANAFKAAENAAAERAEAQAKQSAEIQKNTASNGVAFDLKKADVDALHSIGRKSVNSFTEEDINKAKKFANRMWKELGVKSPFFRAWFGDWRANDSKTKVNIVEVNKKIVPDDALPKNIGVLLRTKLKNNELFRGEVINTDTGYKIQIGAFGYNDTLTYAQRELRKKGVTTEEAFRRINALSKIDELIQSAVLLDSEVIVDEDNPNRSFMHSFYVVAKVCGVDELIKIKVDELESPTNPTKRFYNLNDFEIINKEPFAVNWDLNPSTAANGSKGIASADISISDLFNLVKSMDANFKPKPASMVVNNGGTPKIVYHGTSKGGHTVFDAWGRGKFGLFGIGIYMTEDREVAEGYTKKGKGTTPQVYELYANITNPLDMDKTADVKKWEKQTSGEINFSNCTTNEDCFRAVKEYCEDEGMVRWEAEEYITDMIRGMEYDGITHIGGGRYNKQDATRHRVWIALDSTQIKSATDNIGTFDGSNPDINYSLKGGISATELLDTIEGVQNGKADAKRRLAKYAEDGIVSTEHYNKLVTKYGAIPKGEKPHRDVQVPKKTADNKKVSQTVRTILEAKATPDEALPTIEKMVEDGIFSHEAYSDKKAIKDAEEHLKGNGWTQSFTEWMRDVEKGVVSKQHTVMGWALYNNAVNTAAETTSETERREAMETAFSVLDGMVRHQRSAAQTLQATRILKMLSPETQLYGVQKGKND
ncbi:MAG: hypothetical protein IJN25_03285 [Clostridia bacterium]|nr:hypothetical protein [Clostridia bacterium]